MKLWPTIAENKCFVKMLWHLLGECVIVKVLLVCSSGTVATVATTFFFFFFLYSFVCTSICTFFFFFLLNIYKNPRITIKVVVMDFKTDWTTFQVGIRKGVNKSNQMKTLHAIFTTMINVMGDIDQFSPENRSNENILHAIFTKMINVIEVTPPMWETTYSL